MHDHARRTALLRNLHALQDAVQDLCTPIYGVNDKADPCVIGSGVLIDIGHKTYLLTAAHVLDENSETSMYLPGKPLVSLSGMPAAKTRAPLGDRNKDSIDLAIIVVDQASVGAVAQVARITPASLDPLDAPRQFTAYGFVGYPASQNKARPGKQVRMSSSFIGVVPVEEQRYFSVGAHAALHFAGDFKRNEFIDRNHQRITAPDPHGMSGGGVWRLGRYSEIEQGRATPALIGIGIEFHKENRLLLGVRVPFVVASLRACFPETASSLPPLPPHLSINVTCG